MQIDDFPVKLRPGIDTVGLSEKPARLRVCIVTEEIIGPVRNGGIASTYYHLSKGLAAHGHDVHVLFLKGPVVQDETPEHWVKHFAEFGVTMHYLDVPERPMWAAATEWQERFAAAYQWLRDAETFDVVHTSEWRGGMVYALMAKRLGLAFQETLFLVKTSSPHIWNRHYQMQPIERRELVLAAYAEQKCVELADVVIGGSAHLITFMEQIGYNVQDENVFVQPNIVDFSKVIVTDERPPRAPGDLVKTQDLIFFGRLEGRKGVELMCNALDILKERGVAPERMAFMGKWGAPLATQGGMKVEDYINSKAENWDFPVEIITDKNQPAALSHMCSRDMIAIMPSLIENSTMAVYETLENSIPFIATATGGTPELIDEGDHARCLVEPKATSLADQVERVLREGQVIATSSFSNDRNLEIWYGFHAYMGEQIEAKGREVAIRDVAGKVDAPGNVVDSLSYVTLVRRGDDLDALVDALTDDAPDLVVLGYNDAFMREACDGAGAALTAAGVTVKVVDLIGQAAGDALNMLVAEQSCDAMVVTHGAGVRPRSGFMAAAKAGLSMRPDCLFTTFFTADGDVLGAPMGGDLASHFLSARAYGPELFAMTAATFERLGAFEPYDVRQGILHEYVSRAVEAGPDDLLVYPEELLDWPNALSDSKSLADDTVYSYLKAKPLIDKSSIAQRKITLAALHQTKGSGGALADKVLRDGGRDEEAPLWLMPVDWDRGNVTEALKRRMVVGLDEAHNTLWLYARGPGERRLNLRDSAQEIDTVEAHGEPGTDDYITLHQYKVPTTWEAGTSYPVSWIQIENGQKTRNLFMRINKVTDHTFALAAKHPVMRVAALHEMIERQVHTSQIEDLLEATTVEVPRAAGGSVSSSKIDELLELATGVSSKKTKKSEKRKTAKPKTVAKIDALLELAQGTGRVGLERQMLRARSKDLLAVAGDAPVAGGDVRAFLNAPAQGGAWSDGGWMTGWAWDRADKSRSLRVAVMAGDRPLYMVTADTHMPALGRRTPGLEDHGFRIPVIAEFLAPDLGPLSLRVWDGDVAVRQGDIVLDAEAGVLRLRSEA